ncbi:DUF3450 family protein [Algiphilus sp.]|uniref:DUF3450 family protein n=1 Tax=Algiphilus sp. TaxID=1872431 RepID=UPI0032EF3641
MTRTHRGRAFSALLIGVGVCIASPAIAQNEDIDTLTDNLVSLRSDVESLNSRLNQEQETHKQEMRSLLSRKGQLTNEIRRQELEIERLRKALDEARTEAQSATADAQDLLPMLDAAITQMRAYIEAELPFKRAERLAALDEIQTQLDTGVVTGPKGVNRLWSFYEDELRLARETGLFRQSVELGGERQLADVARLGMVGLYFRTEDGQVGMAVEEGGQWRYQAVSDDAQQDQIVALFDALDKNIRSGYYQLPNPLAEGSQ